MNLAHLFEQRARLCPDHPALLFEGETLSYWQLDEASSRAANGFASLGIGSGDRIAIWLPNTAAFVVAYLGAHKIGAVAVTINTALKAGEIQFILEDSGAQLLLTTAALYAGLVESAENTVPQTLRHTLLVEGASEGAILFDTLLQQASAAPCCVEMEPASPALLLYTSGTTGFPKGALLSHAATVVATQMAVATFELRPTDRVLLPISIFHSFGQTAALLPALAAGATVILHRQFELQMALHTLAADAPTVLFGVPTIYRLLLAQTAPAQMQSLRCCISAGASLPLEIAQQWQAKFGFSIQEGYGLTEIFLGAFNRDPVAKPGSAGTPLAGVRIRIVDASDHPVPPGELGEIVIDTPSIMLGYWLRPAESAAVLRDGWFHTGDIGRMDEDGCVYVVDRLKDMVNVGGVKVYPSEVENILYRHPAVAEAAVYGVPETMLGEQVQASVVLKPGAAAVSQELIAFCRQHLADFKVPSVLHLVDQLPKNRTGKILKRTLRGQAQSPAESPPASQAPDSPADGRPDHANSSLAAATLAHWMATWLAAQLDVEIAQIEWDRPFAELGMTSVMAVSFASALSEHLGQPFDATLLWSFPTIDAVARQLLAASFSPQPSTQARSVAAQAVAEPIALIGIGCRLPGGVDTPEKFWQLLREGVDTVREIPADRWNVDSYYDPNPQAPGKMYMRAGSFLEHVDQFDPQFFGIPALEAASMDPQQRLLLEVTWEALEHAHLPADHLRESRTGVYVGAFWDDYSAMHLYSADAGEVDSYRLLSNLRGMTAGRLAYFLGLHGPAMQVDTACSSSLLAVHLACQALRSGECELALAGGVYLLLAPEQLIGLCKMGAVSPDGRCKSFAAEADGFGVGEGVGMVVLKRLTDALSAGDRILAVIRGSAVNHDGASNGLTAPNGRAQEAMLRQALENAGVTPEQIAYVETHGTGTPLGDPIEVQALINVLGQTRTEPLLLGSVKSNIGHLSSAAGVAALIKVSMALQAGEIPPNLHFTTPNPLIPWGTAPLTVPVTLAPWPPGERRLAGISSFGLTGTNVHLIVEAPPPTPPAEPADRPWHLLTLSANSEQALAAQVAQMDGWLAAQTAAEEQPYLLADLCQAAATSRVHWSHRLGIIAPDLTTLRTRLQQAGAGASAPGIIRGRKSERGPRVAFLFPGQGPQYAGMGRQLYATEPIFRQTLEHCDEILRAHLDRSLLAILYGTDPAQADALLNEATYAQPALFALEYALASLWRTWGIEPAVLIGHSLGEYAAACLAGVFSLEDGLKLVATRGRLMQVAAPKGQMIAVLGSADEVRRILAPYVRTVALAAVNTPQSLVIAGSPDSIQDASRELQQAGIETRPLKIYVASHSPLMEPILAEFATVAQTVTFHRPHLPVISNVTGALADEALATPDYWVRHLREPVQFAQGMAAMAGLDIDTFIEAGPKATLLGMGQQCLPDSDSRLWLRSIQPNVEDWHQLLESLAALYGRNAAIDWHKLDQGRRRTKITLPHYPFQRQRYWLGDSKPQARRSPRSLQRVQPEPQRPAGHPLLGQQVHSVLAARNQEVLFESQLNLTALPYLADHSVFEQTLIPGAAYLEMILAAAAHFWPSQPLVLTDCTIQQGLFLPGDELAPAAEMANEAPGATVQTVFTPAGAAYQWQVYSAADRSQPAAEWTLHASGRIAAYQEQGAPAPMDLAALRACCPTPVDLGEFDRHFQDQGITYGPDFQSLTQLWLGEGVALGYASLPAGLVATAGHYGLHPVLLDAALRAGSSLFPSPASDPYLPFGVERLVVYRPGVYTRLWSYVQQRVAVAGSQQMDITLLDEAGEIIACFTAFALRQASRRAQSGRQRRLDWLYSITWEPVPRPAQSPFAREPGRWIILADRQGYGVALAERLEAQGERCQLLYRAELAEPVADTESFTWLLQGRPHAGSARLRGIVYLWGLDTTGSADDEAPAAAQQLSIEALHLVQALLRTDHSPRLWLVTQQAAGLDAGTALVQVPQASLWGIGRTLHWEQPELGCTCIDLADAPTGVPAPSSAQALFEAVWFADGENQILLRSTERLAARLVRQRVPAPQPLVLDSQGSYLITGGLGGLGLVVAQWLAAQGARFLVLAGRRGATTQAAQAAVQSMVEAGVQVQIVPADIADPAEVRRLLAACQAMAPLRGVIHAAGVIDDALLLQQTTGHYARVMAPKVAGAWHLHTQTRHLPLDFFVCFSSVASLLGNQGQSNYAAANAFMDALAWLRHQVGLPALSINWGGWSEVGLAAELVKTIEAAGLGAITPSEGVDLLGLLLTQRTPQVGVLPIQWRRFQRSLGSRTDLPVLRHLLAPTAAPDSDFSLRQQLARTPRGERAALVKAYVQELFQKLLGVAPAGDENFLLFGLDSLMSIQLANRLSTALDVALPSTLAFKYETVDRLTHFLLATIEQVEGTASDPQDTLPAKAMPAEVLHSPLPTEWYPQLYNQQECYVWHEVVANKACLHVQQCVRIYSPVDSERLAAAMQVLVNRHAALRTIYTRRDAALLQRTLSVQSVDFAAISVTDQPWETLTGPILAAAREPFDLAQGPVLRGRLFSRAASDHVFLLVVHHIAADATALSIIVNELWTIYAALADSSEAALPPVRTEWPDFVRWQSQLLQSAEGDLLWRYWQNQMAGDLPQLNLRTDYPLPLHDSHHGQPVYFEIDAALIQELRQLAQREGCTLYMVLMAGFQLLLHLYTQQRDLLVAAHVANRNDLAFAGVVGYLADTFAIRARISEQATFRSILQQVQPTILGAMEHQGFPMRLLAERLQVQEDASRSALCQVWFTLLPLRLFQESGALFQVGAGSIQRGGLTLEATDLLPAWLGAWYDLEMILTEGDTTVFGTLVYKTELFAEATVQHMIAQFLLLLQNAAAAPDNPVGAWQLEQRARNPS